MSASFSTGLIGGNFVIGDNRIISVSPSSGTDTAGQNLTIQSGRGTGTGTGGSIIFQTAPGGSSGSSANDPATKLTVTVEGIQVAGTGSMSDTLSLTKSSGTGLSVTKDATIGGNLTVTGNLTVSGTSTTINSTTLDVEDINITLAKGNTTPANANGGGITLKAGSDKTIIYDQSQDRWTSNIDWNIASGKVFKINGSSVLSSTALGSTVVASSLTSVGTLSSLTVSGDATFDTSTLKVDSSNNRVGIGTTSPDYKLHVNAGTSGSNTVAFNGIGLVLAGSGGNNGSIGMLFNIRENDGTTSGSGAKAGIFGKDYAGTWNRSSLVFCTNNETNTNDTSISDAKMVIRETGNVGIGDTSPSYKLDVNGTGRFTGALTANVTGNLTGSVLTASQTAITGVGTITTGTWSATTISIAKGGTGATSASAARTALGVDAAGTVNYTLPTASASALGGVKVGSGLSISSGVLSATGSSPWTTSGNDINYTSGKVGIGYASPANSLEVRTSSGWAGAFKGQDNDVAVYLAQKGYGLAVDSKAQTSSTSYLAKFRGSTNGTSIGNRPIMDIMNSGNVGIGTASPDAKLQVNGDFHIEANSDSWSTPGAGAGKGLYMRYSTNSSQDEGYIQSIDRSSNPVVFKKLYYEASTHIFKTGDVGIGTDSPLGTLHIQVSEQYENGLFISSSHGTYGSDSDGGVYHFNHYNHATSTRRGLLMQERNTTGVFKRNIMIFQRGTGNVGIGSGGNGFIEPSHKLDVNGTGRFTGDLTAGANLTVTGNLIVNGTTTTVNSTTMTVDDPIITLGGDTAPGSDDNKDRGVEFRYYDGSAKVGFMGWDDSAGSFVVLKDATNSSEVFSGTAAELKVGSLTIGSGGSLSIESGGSISNLDSLLTTISNLSSLNNVSTTAPSNNQVLTWNGSAWAPADASGGGGGASALNDLSDVSTSGAQTNYALVYNGSSWAPAAQSGSGGSSPEYYSSHIQNISDINQYTGYTVSASTTYGTAYPAEYAFSRSGNKNEGQAIWVSANNTYNSSGSYTGSVSTNSYNGEWIQINFGKKVKVYSYSITGQTGSSNYTRGPGGYKLFGSNNGSSWTEVHAGSATTSDYSSNYTKTKDNTLSTPVTYQYFRLVINSTTGAVLTSIAHLGFHGTFEEPDLVKGAISANVVHQRMTEKSSLSVAANGGKTEIEGLRLTITPQSSSSKVELNYNIFHEANNWNYGFLVSRTVGGTETFFRIVDATNDLTFSASYHDEYSSLPQTTSYSMIDEPNTTGVVVYKVYGAATHTTAITLYINRTKNDGSETGQEHGISTSSVKEFSTFTHNIAEQKVQGRVLETLAGHADGSTVTVSSGTYTMGTMGYTVGSTISTSYVKETASEMTYKAPLGTERITFQFDGFYEYADGGALLEGEFYVDDVKYDGSGSRGHFKSRTGQNPIGKISFPVLVITSQEYDLTVSHKYYWKIKSYSTSHDVKYGYGVDSHYDNNLPFLKIQAIGEENLVYNLTNQYSITEGQVLETLAGVCDGRTVTVSSGTYTLENVTERQSTTSSYVKATGSGINYKPPPGTRQVIFKYHVYCKFQSTGANPLWHTKLKIGDDYVTNQNQTTRWSSLSKSSHELDFCYTYFIDINGTEDVANGKLSSWDTNKQLEVHIRDYASGYRSWLHETEHLDGSGTDKFVPPRLEIIAIGRGVIEGTIGNLYSSKVNMVKTSFSTQLSLTPPSSRPGVEIEPARLVIKPTATDSVIELKFSMYCDGDAGNIGFRITRNIDGTDVLVAPASNNWEGFLSALHGGEHSTHNTIPTSVTTLWYDEPNTTSEVTYKLWLGYSATSGNAPTVYINRTASGTGSSLVETGVSTAVAIEHPQQTTLHNPRYNSVIEQEGQTLETLVGVCDGRSVTVSSGTYTLEEVTASQTMTTAWVKATGSEISYKPPPGTTVIKFTFRYAMRYGSGSTDVWHQVLYLDDTQVSSTEETVRPGSANFETMNQFVCILSIGETNDVANGKLASWDTLKKLEVRMGSYESTRVSKLHITNLQAFNDATDLFIPPQIEIEAIGRKSDTTFLNSFFNERKGQVLETLTGVCDGRTITVDSGTYTLQNVTTEYQPATGSWVLCTGSSIDYKPPPGAKQVIYCYTLCTGRVDSRDLYTFRFKIDNTEVTKQVRQVGIADPVYGNLWNLKFVIDIGTDDISNGRVISWDSLKNLKVEIYVYSNDYDMKLHYNQYYENNTDVSGYTFTAPALEIQAIGDAAIQNATVVAGNSMVHFQGYSDTVTTTNSIRYISGYEDAPTSGNFTTGLPVLKNFGNAMNTSTGIFTTPHTGLYSINVVVHKHNETNSGRVTLVIDDKETSFGDSLDYYDNSGVSSVYHIDSGKQVYLKSPSSNTFPTAVNLSITALQDQVPQAISSRPGMVLETLAGVCDGRSVTVSSGTYTLPTIESTLALTTTFTDIGTSFSYKPPSGTRQIIYTMKIHTQGQDAHSISYYRLFVDNTEVTAFRQGHNGIHADELMILTWTFTVADVSSDDIANGRFTSWDSNKTIMIKGAHIGSSNAMKIFGTVYEDGSTTYQFVAPILEIQAIGDGPGIVPSTGMNIVHVSDSTYFSQTITAKTIKNYEYQAMRLVIKPTATDSVIELKYSIFAEMDHNVVFRITRNINGTDVLVVPSTNFDEGVIGVGVYDQQYTTTPQTVNFTHYDEPNTTSTVTYKVWLGSTHPSNKTVYFNGGNTSSGGDFHELGVSKGAAIEYPKTARPLDTENALTIPPFVGAINKEKLYNQSGDLYFNGKQLSNEWHKNAGDLYRLGANVGIGKSSPAYKLDVTGDINFTNSLRKNGTALGEWNASGSDIYRSTGNVGIGTTSPSQKLDIEGSGGSASGIIRFTDIDTADNARNWFVGPYRSGDACFAITPSSTKGGTSPDTTKTFQVSYNGYVGIGTTSPDYPLDVDGGVFSSTGISGTKFYARAAAHASSHTGTYTNTDISIRCEKGVWAATLFATSDSRIKENIEDVPDNLALEQVRNIPCRYYEYRDKVSRGSDKTIGFIAQEVESVLPMAVNIQTGIIPNVYKIISCEWTGNVMSSQELGTVNGVKYKFYVSNTDNDETEINIVGSSDNTFTFEQQWTDVFCYGHEVKDLHTIDKNKLFALNFSATQELDRQQQADKAKIASLETKVASLESELAAIKAHLGL